MRKNYFFTLLAVMLTFCVTGANAAVTSMTDLFGTYKFTATLEVVDESYAELFKSECEVTITKEQNSIYDAAIQGLGGAALSQYVSTIDMQGHTFTVRNINGSNGLWDKQVYLTDAEGHNPYGPQGGYEFVYTYVPDTKIISLPDFSVVTVDGWDSEFGTIVAKFTNVQLVPVGTETVEVDDLEGEWTFTSSSYDEESAFPHEFIVTLTKASDDNKNYDVEMAIDGYEAVNTTATFDGVRLSVAYDNLYLDKENRILFSNYQGTSPKGTYDFSYNSSTSLVLSSGMSIVKLYDTTDEEGNPVVKSEFVQYYNTGRLSRPGEPAAFTWDGVYSVKGQAIPASGFENEFGNEFTFTVEYVADQDAYYIVEFMGEDTYSLNNGGIPFTVAEDGKSAAIKAGTFLKMVDEATYSYYMLNDAQNGTNPVTIKMNEDGTFTMDAFFVTLLNYFENTTVPAAFYQNLTVTKEAVAPFSWAGGFEFTADVNDMDTVNAYPANFNVQIIFSEYNETYYVTTFMGCDVAMMTYGGLPLTISEDGKSATMPLEGALVAGEYPNYIQLCNANGEATSLTFTLVDGVLTLSDFALYAYNYDSGELGAKLAEYTNVKGGIVSANEFDWAGTYTHNITMPDAYYPDAYEMRIVYSEATGAYYVEKFLGYELGDLNYGGLMLTVSESDPTKATIKLDGAYGVALLTMLENYNFLQLCDAEGNGVSLDVTLNADGSLTIAPFKVYEVVWGTQIEKVGEATDYPEGVAYKGGVFTGIEEVIGDAVAEDTIDMTGSQYVVVYDAAGRVVFAGAASEVSNLAKGLYIVKSGNATLKMFVK